MEQLWSCQCTIACPQQAKQGKHFRVPEMQVLLPPQTRLSPDGGKTASSITSRSHT